MLDPVTTTVLVLSLLVALVALAYTVLGRAIDPALLGGVAVLEAALLVQLVVGVAQVASGAPEGVSVVTFVGYLLGIVVLPPLGALWALGERSRSGTAVLVVAMLVVPVLVLRLGQIWTAGG